MFHQLGSAIGTSRALRVARSTRAVSHRALQQAAFEGLERRELFSTFTVVNTLDSGAGSLRQAILDANAHVNGGGADVVAFNIPGAGAHLIKPATPLPALSESVTIDGYSQPGTKPNTRTIGNDAIINIGVDGSDIVPELNQKDGFSVLGDATTIRGLLIRGFKKNADGFGGSGISLNVADGPIGHKVEGCFISNNEGSGVDVRGFANHSTVGGVDPGQRNVIIENGASGIRVSCDDNTIQNNYIGISANGDLAAPNAADGVTISSINNTVVGNVISGNGLHGVNIGDADFSGNTDNNTIVNNRIGTTANGLAAVGNHIDGVHIRKRLAPFTSTGNSVLNNLIAGNGDDGVQVSDNCTDVTIRGNLIGCDLGGNAALPNEFGVFLDTTSDVTIDNNVISGNREQAVLIDETVDTVAITANLIGVGINKTTDVGNGFGIEIFRSDNITIGGDDAEHGNIIAFNHGNGVNVLSGDGIRITHNSIHSNAFQGIDLGDNGVDTNDDKDADAGDANHGQNFPLIATARAENDVTTIDGTLNTTPNTAVHIEMFVNDEADANGFGEGRRFIGEANGVTNSLGDIGFTFSIPSTLTGFVSATATNTATSETSEFSQARTIEQRQTGGTIGGLVYRDDNGNATHENTEIGLANVTVFIDEDNDGALDTDEPRDLTDATGTYRLNETKNGSFVVQVLPPKGTVTTENPAGVVARFEDGSIAANANFGLFTLGEIIGTAFTDANGNGTQDAGESALAGVKVNLDLGANSVIDATATSGADGSYVFKDLGPGVFRIRAVAPNGTTQTSTNPNDVTMLSGLSTVGLDFGFKPAVAADTFTFVSDLNPTYACNGFGSFERDKSNGEAGAHDGKTITLEGVQFNKGLGVHATSELRYALNGQFKHFLSKVGVDDEVGTKGSVVFQVFADGVKLFDSGKMTGSSATKSIDVDVTGKKELRLIVTDGGNGNAYDHADWADAKLSKGAATPPGDKFLSDLSAEAGATNGFGAFERDRSNGESGAADGHTITLNGKTYAKGLGVHAGSSITYKVAAGKTKLFSDVGIDDEVGNKGSVRFKIFGNGNVLIYDSGAMTGSSATKQVAVDVSTFSTVKLVVEDGGNGNAFDHGDWANARFSA